MKRLLFTSLRQWRICMAAGCAKFLWGLWRIVSGIIFGILSVFWWIGRLVEAFCRREPIAAAVIAVLLLILSFGWLSTYVSARTHLTTAEYQRDSIGYVLDRYMQAYDSVVVDGDTLKYQN